MARKCSICTRADRTAIDEALVSNDSFRNIAYRFGLSEAALRRHAANHLPEALLAAQAAREVIHGDNLLDQVRHYHGRMEAVLSAAEQSGNRADAIKAVREIRGLLEFQAKLLGQLAAQPTVNVLISPEWERIAATLLSALHPLPDARAAAAQALLELEHAKP